ncbi:NAD(P)-binding domain-containing protein [Streptomyces sp. NPDC005863]|uniref:NAD(P)-binding domain-containing protein n=1 Tax=Streptomyces sp. NPDC005863 TaxID=3364735 RepID=UPI00367FE615
MSTVGWIGLGKLGAVCALTLAKHGGHRVIGYDPSPRPAQILRGEVPPPQEEGIEALLPGADLTLASSPAQVVATADDVVFVAVQTPHSPAYGGETPMPQEPQDFEYQYLVQAVRDLCRAAAEQAKPITIAVISTCLPGTMNRLIRPLLNEFTTLVYNPAFIAMGTTIADCLKPEFVLIGADDRRNAQPVLDIHATVHDRPAQIMSIESAELTKVAYNVAVSTKIVVANAIMEICHKTGADCDAVTDALAAATDRVVSAKYMRGGMGDGGHCHPRDLIAMSWLAQRLDLSTDVLGYMVRAREAQSSWLADLVQQWGEQTGFDIMILGKAYKPGSDLTGGSPALLLAHQLRQRGLKLEHWDPHVDTGGAFAPDRPGVFVIATRHDEFPDYRFPSGSVVIDPHGYMPDQPGVTTTRVGRKG